jgi:hypothetical protein
MTLFNYKQSDLTEDDLKFFAMTREEEDERCNRLAFKSLNGIVDDEVVESFKRTFRNWELMFGKKEAIRKKAEDEKYFGKWPTSKNAKAIAMEKVV